MAKKTAPKKKAAPVKAKAAGKATKPATKPVAKSAAKPVKATKKAEKPVVKAAAKAAKPVAPGKPVKLAAKPELKSAKPSLMTKKGKAEVEVEAVEAKKNSTIVSILETSASDEPSKVEKVSKVKPVKVDRGNLNDEKAKWAELFKKYGKDKAATYKMSESYQSLIPLQHKVLGWGFVLTNENDRLEVLFENGIRMLISNYKT